MNLIRNFLFIVRELKKAWKHYLQIQVACQKGKPGSARSYLEKIFTGMGRDIAVSGIGFQFKGGFFAGDMEIELEKNPESLTTTELNVNDDKIDEYLEHVNVFARMNLDINLRSAEDFPVFDFLVICCLGTLNVRIVEIYKYFKFGKSRKEKKKQNKSFLLLP